MRERKKSARAAVGMSRWAKRRRRLGLPGDPRPDFDAVVAENQEVKRRQPIRCPVCGRVDYDERKAEEHYQAAHETFSG